ncbi:hypothetical protein L0128_09760, partial [candidate division KSB1 bacterium]|nr:hypothetical protein [candidate division KSB1 bacterium]
MSDFRFEGTTLTGRRVQGIIQATNLSDAKKKIHSIREQRKLSISQIQKRRTFVYMIQKNG